MGETVFRFAHLLARVAEDGHDLDMAHGRADAEADAAHELDRAKLSTWADVSVAPV